MRGVLVIDNTSRGMEKGGTRMSRTPTVREVSRLARTMTWKWAAVSLFHGGAKAGIRRDPNTPDKEGILRAFARALSKEVSNEYVFGLEMGLTEQDAAIFVDELGDPGAAFGLPGAMAPAVRPARRHRLRGGRGSRRHGPGGRTADSRVAIQGFGAVGQAAAERLVELGAVVTAVSTVEGAGSIPAVWTSRS